MQTIYPISSQDIERMRHIMSLRCFVPREREINRGISDLMTHIMQKRMDPPSNINRAGCRKQSAICLESKEVLA